MIVIRTLMIGLAGGALAWLSGLPAAWLSGSLIATLLAVMLGIRLQLPEALRRAAFVLLGLQTGLSVTPETLDRAQHWPASLVVLAVTVILIVWACMLLFSRVFQWSRDTALFASLPGALSLVLLLAEGSQADMRKVLMSQGVRLIALVVALPLCIQLFLAPHSSPAMPVMTEPWQILLSAVVASIAGVVLERLKVPAGLIMGACIASAALVLSGVVAGAMPSVLLIPANAVLGIMIGIRMQGTSRADFREAFGAGAAGFLLALVIAIAGAVLTSRLTSLPLALTMLAFAPGGLEAMTIMAFALNLDPAYVALHQVARYLGLVLLMPVVTSWLLRKFRGRPVKAVADAVNDGD